MAIIHEDRIIIQSIAGEWYQNKVECVDMLRLDRVHDVISGNKWFKLKHNLAHAVANKYAGVLTFGGGYSNHLVAAAAAAQAYGLKAVGVVRGKYEEQTSTLKDCVAYGMELKFVSREGYAQQEHKDWQKGIVDNIADWFVIPEGGANEWGRAGAGDIAKYIPDGYTHICISVGTGTTIIGLTNALPEEMNVIGFVPMKGGRYLQEAIDGKLEKNAGNVELTDEWHFGGFGKWNEELIGFMNAFYECNKIPLDMVYTGKMMYGVKEMILHGDYFTKEAKILCVHTGGLQGNESVRDKLVY